MIKRLIAAMLIIASLASVSSAKVHDLGKLTVDLPTGWIANKINEFSYMFKTSDNTAAVMFDISSLGDTDPKEAAEKFSKNMSGSTPVYNEQKNEYTFTYRDTEGIVYNVSLTPFAENDIIVMCIWAEVERALLEQILSSIKFK